MNRNISLDLLKLSMALMVVGIHTGFYSEFSPLLSYLFIEGLFRIAVPVFFIINGFYFYSALERGAQRTWLKRVVVLYIIWMFFYSVFWFFIPELTAVDLLKLLYRFLVGYFHLWYISGLIGAAIVLLMLKELTTKFLLVTIGITFFIGVLIQYIGNYHLLEGTLLDKVFNKHEAHRNFIFFAYPFFCIGFLFNKHSVYKQVPLPITYLITVLGGMLLLTESYVNYIQPLREGAFDNYFSLIFICPALFLLCLKKQVNGSSKNIALYASAIYFIHVFILSVLHKIFNIEATSLTVLTIVFSIITSFFIVHLNKRFKFIL
ncbi:acyltransferase [Colwellia sp. E2M01]|uniref:acyltransferase family protein n=1 Tax=Colwellia sp. E2M01 TaxID=2841561 RepID=UPI001C08BA29|nr:acyltransferase [Colwellia sp. E2M01]MBU2870038.1 acyltransferase [Colwellia sp. E2M01]